MINVMTTFWRFLNEHTIEIPIIQRDYAQGRQDADVNRVRSRFLDAFLKDMKQALDSCKPLKLDFVYGAVESGKLNPLDGQQRLTTLWLLHWYLAYMAGAMNKDVKRVLAKFTYETRISSREFCGCLADFDKLPPPGADVVGHIQNQTWFRSAWKDDPTIQSMLRMLGGTAYNNNDGIEGVFHSCYDGECIECRLDQCPYSKAITYGEYWQRLIGTDCPIIFYSLDIHGINQTDDLYIKMNARGKPLTSFENFKADLAGYIQNRTKAFSADEKWMKLGKEDTGFVIKMDTNWMDIFWRRRSSDNAVDDIYFAFLNRYFFNAYVLQFEKTGDLQKAEDPIFDFLYGGKDGENEKIAYLGFDEIFRKVLNKDNTLLERLYNTLDNFSKFDTTQDKRVLSLFEAPWNCEKEDMEKFRFIPHYIKKESIIDFAGNRIRKIARITQPQRVVFHAICKFFEQVRSVEDAKEELLALKDWMRVVWNIVENANVDTIPGMIGCLKLIDELGSQSHNILGWLKSSGRSLKSEFAKDQVDEEIEKAEQVVLDQSGEWKDKIEKAENTAYFKGAIRFLFRDDRGKTDWSEFNKKFANAGTFFDASGVKESYKTAITRALVLACEKWNENGGLYDNQMFNPNANTWKRILCSKSFAKAVHCILTSDVLKNVSASTSLDDDQNATMYVKPVLGDFPFQWAVKNVPEGRIKWTYSKLAFYKPYSQDDSLKIIFDWETFRRNSMLYALRNGNEITIDSRNIIKDCSRFVLGWDVSFKYNDCWFRWLGSPNSGSGEYDIYLLKEEWKDDSSYATHDQDLSKVGDAQKYYCFNVKLDIADDKEKVECFKIELENQIKAAQSILP